MLDISTKHETRTATHLVNILVALLPLSTNFQNRKKSSLCVLEDYPPHVCILGSNVYNINLIQILI